jgi:hypothetical protein
VQGRYGIADLRASLPGVGISGHGNATAREVDVRLRLVAANLAALTRNLTPPRDTRHWCWAGAGARPGAGRTRRRRLRVAGQFPCCAPARNARRA